MTALFSAHKRVQVFAIGGICACTFRFSTTKIVPSAPGRDRETPTSRPCY